MLIENMFTKGEMYAYMREGVSISIFLSGKQVELCITSLFFGNKNCLEKDHIDYPGVYVVVKHAVLFSQLRYISI